MIKSAQRPFAVALALLTLAALVLAQPRTYLDNARAIGDALAERAADAQTPLAERLQLRLRIGTLTADDPEFKELERLDAGQAMRLRAELFHVSAEYERAQEIIEHPANMSLVDDALRYRWLLLREDLSRVDGMTRGILARDSGDAVSLWARGELLYRMVRYDEAEAYYTRALRRADTHRQRADARLGLSKVYDKRNEHQRGLDTLAAALNAEMLSSDVLHQMGLLLIDLSRVSEAIDLIEEAVRWNPHSEMGHYFLGNGYARLNYTQLREKYPRQFGDDAAVGALAASIGMCGSGQWEFGHVSALDAHMKHPDAVEPLALLGSIAWTCERMDEAADYFRRALERCPEYGRAHNGLAKALEGRRLRMNVHRAADSARFAAEEMPSVPKIDEYVINWKGLSPRHQKQVALAVAPWQKYIPLLAETGQRHYIKPLHERLSESPGLETLEDQRIGYDSRLWDDVRGCGGYTTVTGIEDVERSIYASYNTVLHELTHQVHGVFPPEDQQKLEDRYREARNLEAKDRKVFMSQYQAASVWEYFAEGANAYYSPRRNEYDIREVVRERLMELDTVLARLVEHYVQAPNLEDCYPVGLVNAAQNAVEQRNLDRALSFALKAHKHSPRSEAVLAELSFEYSLRDEDRKAIAWADSLRKHYPRKANSYQVWKTAHFFRDGKALESVKRLEAGLSVVDSTEEKSLRQGLGNELWYAGEYARAAEQYRFILSRHDRDSDALWGLGLALGDQREYATADSAFKQALLERSGITDLRLDYARILLQAGRLDDAETQIREASLLSPDDPGVLTMQGWLAAARGDHQGAMELYDRAVKVWPYDRLPQILRIESLSGTGESRLAAKEARRLQKLVETDIPVWKYHETRYTYTPAYVWPAFQKSLLNRVSKMAF